MEKESNHQSGRDVRLMLQGMSQLLTNMGQEEIVSVSRLFHNCPQGGL